MKPQKRVTFPFHFSRDKKLLHVVVTMEDKPGALAGVLELLKGRANLIGTTSYNIEGGLSVFSGFAESLEPSIAASELEQLLAKSPTVVEAMVRESKQGLLTDSFHTGIRLGLGDPEILMNRDALSEMFADLVRVFGSGGELILFRSGTSYGKKRSESLRRAVGTEVLRSNFDQLTANFGALGWGVAKFGGDDGTSLTVTIDDCFECSAEKGVKRSCSFMRGFLVGFLSPFSEGVLECQEKSCRLDSGSRCEFVLVKKVG